MRLLLFLLIAGVAAHFTIPTRAQHEAAARAYLEANPPGSGSAETLSLDSVVNYVRGMMAGQGSYETFYVASKYSADLPGASFLECFGAFTLVQCRVVAPEAPQP